METKETVNDEQLKRLESFLRHHRKTIDMLTKHQLEQLIKVDNVIQLRLKINAEAWESIKKSKINIMSIAADLSIQRQTIYNNELIKKYIEQAQSKLIEPDDISVVEKLRQEKNFLQDQIRGLILRDVKEADLRYENDKLLKEIAILQQQVVQLTEQHIHDLEIIRKLQTSAKRTVYVIKDAINSGDNNKTKN